MSAHHTPGPWEMAEAGSWKDGKRTSLEYFVRRPDDDVAIASDIIDPDNSQASQANARLIAASPDLLAACCQVVHILDSDGKNSQSPLVITCRGAIAKAQGKEAA